MTDTSADSEVTGGFLDGAKFRVYAFEYIKFYFKIAPLIKLGKVVHEQPG